MTKLNAPPIPAEYNRIVFKVAVGFVVMGFIGFFVKLIFIVSRYCGRQTGFYRQLTAAFSSMVVSAPTTNELLAVGNTALLLLVMC